MNGNKIFLDTNIVIYILSGKSKYIELVKDKDIFVSIITELELLSYDFDTNSDEIKTRNFLEFTNIVGINKNIKELTISVRKKYNLKLPDSIILATALNKNIDLETKDKDLYKTYNKIKKWFK